MFSDHLKSCEYCQKGLPTHKLTIFIKSASAYRRESRPTIHIKRKSDYDRSKKLLNLGDIIKGTSYASLSPWLQTKGASVVRKPGPIEREVKLKALGKMVRG